jgi:hypothetical protein
LPATTTTVGEQGTTTTLPPQQGTKHGSSTDVNACTSRVDLASGGNFLPPSDSEVTVTLATDAFPDPHNGDEITLSNTKLTIAVPAGVLQTGVDAGIISDGMQIPTDVEIAVNGSGTTQGSHTYNESQVATVVVEGGQAQPLESTIDLEDTTWTPVDDQTPVIFTQGTLSIVAEINVLGGLVAHFDCEPSTAPAFMVLPAFADQVVTTTTLGQAGGTTPTTTTTTAPTDSDSLPRTGASALFWLVIAAVLIDLGVVAVIGTRRRGGSYLR